MRIAEADILILPGSSHPAPGHWQRRWGERFSTAQVVEPEGGERPELEPWVDRIERQIMLATRPVVLVAHSLAVVAVAHTAARLKDTKVRGGFLVAPPDLELNPNLPAAARALGPVPRDPLPFPSMLIASSSDAYCSVERAAEFATCWGSDFHLAGDAGQLDAASGHGPWPEGLMMFTRLMQRLRG